MHWMSSKSAHTELYRSFERLQMLYEVIMRIKHVSYW